MATNNDLESADSSGEGISRRTFVRTLGLGAFIGSIGVTGLILKLKQDTSRRGKSGGHHRGAKVGSTHAPVFREIPGRIVGANANIGHRLRELGPRFSGTADSTDDVEVAIVGSGIGALSSGRIFRQAGIQRLAIFELEENHGGNSQWGSNPISAYPWGAHYLPVPPLEAQHVREFLSELSLLEPSPQALERSGQKKDSREKGPAYSEFALCATPQERIFMHGKWYEGSAPSHDLPEAELREHERFAAQMAVFRNAMGADGRKAFAIPLDQSSKDPIYTALDKLSFNQWLAGQGYRSPSLLWYADYCCRDDFGARTGEISAWAGVHYFASRKPYMSEIDETSESPILTWPKGNGELADALFKRACAEQPDAWRPGSLVVGIRRAEKGQYCVRSWDHARDRVTDTYCGGVVLGVPLKNSLRLLSSELQDSGVGRTLKRSVAHLKVAPWLVANITIRGDKKSGRLASDLLRGEGAACAWDNIIYRGKGLGYVVATHQSLQSVITDTVITYYRPLDHLDPSAARVEAQKKSIRDWQMEVLSDLEVAHPGLANWVSELDVMVWGHGMARPEPGFLADPDRLGLVARRTGWDAGIAFAHSDLSHYSIFEEAFEHGVNAAHQVLEHLKQGRVNA